MASLMYSALTSLDGFIEDADGKFDWAEPDREVHTFINDLVRPYATYLYGRSLYEVMTAWENDELIKGWPDYALDFARMWRAADKVVYSRSLERVSTARTQLKRSFDVEAIRRLKTSPGSGIAIGGANLASHAFRAGLVDECHMFVAPISVGGGKSAYPIGIPVKLELLDQRRFANGVVYLRYSVRSQGTEG